MTDTASRDIYSRIATIDESTLRSIAEVLEIRGRHPQQAQIRTAYLDAGPDWRGANVIEIGCGTGVISRDLARRVGSTGSVLGIDPSSVFLDEAQRRARAERLETVRFVPGDGSALDLPDASFDVAVAATVLCHAPRRNEILRELARVVRPGGALVLFDGDYASNQLEHPDRETTEKILAAWRENMVDDPRVMRRIAPMIRAVGLEIDRFDGHIHVETGTLNEETSYIWQWALLALRQGLADGVVDEAGAAEWLDALRGLNARGELFGAVSYYSLVARKP